MPARRKATRRKNGLSKRQVKFWASVIITVLLFFMQQNGKPITKTGPVTDGEVFENVSVASVYDGDTFKINLNCSLAVYCEKVPVRVRGVDTPEIKGNTEREKQLARKAKVFTQEFLQKGPISLSNCGRDKYFRLLCDVKNGQNKDLARELIKNRLGYAYQDGTKSSQFQ